MRWLHFILSHSIFIAFCGVAMCVQTVILLRLELNAWLLFFIFFSTLASYNFYWLISKYSFERNKISWKIFARKNIFSISLSLFSGLLMLFFLWFVRSIWVYVCISILLTLLYSLPLWPFAFALKARRAGFLKTVLLAFTWAFVTTVIPAVPGLKDDVAAVLILLAARFFFFMMLALIFDMRDKEIDKIRNLRSLATDAAPKALRIAMYLLFILYMAAGLFVRIHFDDGAQVAAFFITGLLVWFVYQLSLRKRGYFFYYFVVDGLMLFSLLASLLATV
ncbi:MAG: hypothetical protein WAT19_03180 [Ferruginibacter sp.]